MMQSKDFLSKKCISLNEGLLLGIVTNIAVDEKIKKVVGLIIDNSYCLSINDFFKNENDVIVFTTNRNTTPLNTCNIPPFYTDVFSTSGCNKGMLTDMLFDEKFNIKMFATDNTEFFSKDIYSYSSNALILKDCKMPKQINLPPKQVQPPPYLPIRACGNYDFLLGKLCKKTIFTRNKEIIIKCSARVKPDTIVKARLNGKLVELSLACR